MIVVATGVATGEVADVSRVQRDVGWKNRLGSTNAGRARREDINRIILLLQRLVRNGTRVTRPLNMLTTTIKDRPRQTDNVSLVLPERRVRRTIN